MSCVVEKSMKKLKVQHNQCDYRNTISFLVICMMLEFHPSVLGISNHHGQSNQTVAGSAMPFRQSTSNNTGNTLNKQLNNIYFYKAHRDIWDRHHYQFDPDKKFHWKLLSRCSIAGPYWYFKKYSWIIISLSSHRHFMWLSKFIL